MSLVAAENASIWNANGKHMCATICENMFPACFFFLSISVSRYRSTGSKKATFCTYLNMIRIHSFRWRHISKHFPVKCTITSCKLIENQIVFFFLYFHSFTFIVHILNWPSPRDASENAPYASGEQNLREIATNILKRKFSEIFQICLR